MRRDDLGGDTVAMRLCLERDSPSSEGAPLYTSPCRPSASDAMAALAAITAAVAVGAITTGEGADLNATVAGFIKAVATTDIEARVAAWRGRRAMASSISFFKEERSDIAILPPSAFLNSDDRYDLVLNADSLTELDVETASAYCGAFRDRTNIFLSINHEINPFTVHELYAALAGPAVSRAPYWMGQDTSRRSLRISEQRMKPQRVAIP